MSGTRTTLVAILAMLALAGVLVGCAEEHGLEVAEGEPVELGELTYHVQLTRFLNPRDIEDAQYLVGQPPSPEDTSYLGVFLRIANESDHELRSADRYELFDIRGDRFEPIEAETPIAFDIGGPVPAGGELPPPEAPLGSATGGLLLFLVDDTVIGNRPVTLEIHDEAATGEVELDI